MARRANLPAGEKGGAIVSGLSPRGAAAAAGVIPGDVILSVNGAAVTSLDDVSKAIDATPSGHSVRLNIWRPASQGGPAQSMFLLVPKR